MLSSSQRSPRCSPTVDWWTSCRQSSPPPLLRPPLCLPVLLWLCCAAAISCYPPSLPCSAFTPLRYTPQLSSALITTPGCNFSNEGTVKGKTHNTQQNQLKSWVWVLNSNNCMHLICITVQICSALFYSQQRFWKTSFKLNPALSLISLPLFNFSSSLPFSLYLISKVHKSIIWSLDTAVQRLFCQKRNTDNLLLGNDSWITTC